VLKYGDKVTEKQITIDTNENDWYEFGKIIFLKNQDVKVTISSLSNKEFVADAILFVPVNR
jgi:hypothetical protein